MMVEIQYYAHYEGQMRNMMCLTMYKKVDNFSTHIVDNKESSKAYVKTLNFKSGLQDNFPATAV